MDARRRSGWWDTTTDIELQKRRVKDMISHAVVDTETKKKPFETPVLEPTPSKPISVNILDIATAAENHSQKPRKSLSKHQLFSDSFHALPDLEESDSKIQNLDKELCMTMAVCQHLMDVKHWDVLLSYLSHVPLTIQLHFQMKCLVFKRQFMQAIQLVHSTYKQRKSQDQLPRNHKRMLRDLLYMLHTFQLVFRLEQGHFEESLEYLELEMSPHRDVEMRSNNDRANWFAHDYEQWMKWVKQKSIPNDWNWQKECDYFFSDSPVEPLLYKDALKEFFNCPVSLEYTNLSVWFDTWKQQSLEPPKMLEETNETPEKKTMKKRPSTISKNTTVANTAPLMKDPESGTLFTQLVLEPPAFRHVPEFQLLAEMDGGNTVVKSMDMMFDSERQRMIIATAGEEDRTDRRIRIWDAKTGQMIQWLDKETHKMIVSLKFHPLNPQWLISADMEHDVKLWDWTTGKLIRTFKKIHSRIIYSLGFLPEEEMRVVSCSADQTLKMWDLRDDRPSIASIHANEPITSFIFCGEDASNRMIAVSLNYSIRIYKLRTLQLLQTIPLSQLKTNKTPIIHMNNNPLHKHLVCVSSDQNVRLVDLSNKTSEPIIKLLNARELGNGLRIQAEFSPCGHFIYSGSSDSRSLYSKASGITTRGVYVWDVYQGKLENACMRASRSVDANLGETAVSVCQWKSYSGKSILVAAYLDKKIRIFVA